MDTPCMNHIYGSEFGKISPRALNQVYEPAEDSMLFIDALELDLEYLKAKKPIFCLEVGSGSGIVVTAVRMAFPDTLCFATDINLKACEMTKTTADHNYTCVESVNMDLIGSFLDYKFDVIMFNPPYVVTESKECTKTGIEVCWAGGIKGREVTDRLLDMIPKKLAADGTFYLLLIEDNIPSEVIDIMSNHGFLHEIVVRRRVRNEQQLVLKFYR